MQLLVIRQLSAPFSPGSEFFEGGVALMTKANMKLIPATFMHTGVVLIS
jgi:hypothetical protein